METGRRERHVTLARPPATNALFTLSRRSSAWNLFIIHYLIFGYQTQNSQDGTTGSICHWDLAGAENSRKLGVLCRGDLLWSKHLQIWSRFQCQVKISVMKGEKCEIWSAKGEKDGKLLPVGVKPINVDRSLLWKPIYYDSSKGLQITSIKLLNISRRNI